MDLEKRLQKSIEKERFFKKGEKMIVGVSGGIDSMALLFTLNKLKDRYNLHIIVAHLNHGLRKEAGKDELFVKEYAEKNYVDFVSKKIKLPSKNIEEKAREVRYSFLEEIKKEEVADSIVTAHTANDQAETVLLNLTRGSGIRGLKGMEPKNRVKRPFLLVERSEIEKYAKKNKLRWREDKTNLDLKFARNRIRHKVIPELKIINPNVTENILRTSLNLAEYSHFLKNILERKIKKLTIFSENSIKIDLTLFKKLDNFIQKEIILECLYKLSPKNIEKKHLENIIALLDTKGSKELNLPLGLKAEKIYDNLIISPKEIKKGKIKVKKAFKNTLFWAEKYQISLEKSSYKNNNLFLIDAGKAGNLYIRVKKAGDFLYLKEGRQKKKISDIFIDAKVPKKKRENYPIVVNKDDEIVLIPGIRLNTKFGAGGNTKNIIEIRIKELNEK